MKKGKNMATKRQYTLSRYQEHILYILLKNENEKVLKSQLNIDIFGFDDLYATNMFKQQLLKVERFVANYGMGYITRRRGDSQYPGYYQFITTDFPYKEELLTYLERVTKRDHLLDSIEDWERKVGKHGK